MAHKIIAFTKPDCPHCARAKAALKSHNLPYHEVDITQSARNKAASIYFSGVATVPQIFVGNVHINGADDVDALAEAGWITKIDALATGELALDEIPDKTLVEGAQDVLLRDIIPESDGSRDDDPETWEILRFYKKFFGFWPNCFYLMHNWKEAYKLFVYCHNAGAIGGGASIVGAPVMMASAFATSNAHGCSYCMVHAKSTGKELSLGLGPIVEAARKEQAPADAPIGPFEIALIDLAALATTNEISADDLDRAVALRPAARLTDAPPEANVMGVAMIASAFGFLNVFNDLTGVKVEAEWAAKTEQVTGITAGRHGVSTDRQSNNLDYDLPTGGPDLHQMMAKYDGLVLAAGGVETYALSNLGLVPAWFLKWPAQHRARHAHLYIELMQDRPHARLPVELKHLMARVSAIARNHSYLAAIEGYLAASATNKTAAAVERVRHAFDAATGKPVPDALFSARECAALQFAWVSAQLPLTTPRRFVENAISHFSPVELVHLATICGLAGLVQRFCAIAKPKLEKEVEAFLSANRLDAEPLHIRYPVARPEIVRAVG